MLGSEETRMVIFEDACDHNPSPTLYSRTDRQTSYDGNTALRYASRGKKTRKRIRAGPSAFSWVHCQHVPHLALRALTSIYL